MDPAITAPIPTASSPASGRRRPRPLARSSSNTNAVGSPHWLLPAKKHIGGIVKSLCLLCLDRFRSVRWRSPNVVLKLSELTEMDEKAIDTARSELELLGYWPLDKHECRISDYSQAILEYDDSTRMADRPSYRLAEIIAGDGAVYSLGFTHGSYFDGIDTSEPLAHETAMRYFQKDSEPSHESCLPRHRT